MDIARLILWVLACIVFATTQQSRPVLVLSTVVVLRLLVPSGGGGLLLGDWSGNQALHPATVLLLVHLGSTLRGRGAAVAVELRSRAWWHLGVTLVAFLLSVQAVVGSGPTSMLGLTNAVLSPMVLCFLLRLHERETPGVVRRVVFTFLTVMVLIALLVIVQATLQTGAPWSLRDPLFGPTGGGRFRPRGTLDSPLDLGFAAAVAIPLTSYLRRGHVRIVVAVVLLAAIVLSASRVPTVLALVGAAWVGLRALRTFAAVVTALVSAVAGTALAVWTGLLDGIVERFSGADGSSAAARDVAAEYAVEHLWDHVFAGAGWGAAWKLKGTALTTSLENSYVILAYDLGLVCVVILLTVQVAALLGRWATAEARLAGAIAITLGFCYSGLVTMSAASTVLWLALAVCLQERSATEPDAAAADPLRNGQQTSTPIRTLYPGNTTSTPADPGLVPLAP